MDGVRFVCGSAARVLRRAAARRSRAGRSRPGVGIRGRATLGLALWTVHFTALLALRLPVSPAVDIPLTLLSIEPALVAAAAVLWLRRKGHLEGLRLVAAVVTLTLGVTATRYFGI